jgi:hypothetical protein
LQQALDVSARNGLPRYLTLQPPYNLYDRATFEGPLASLCIREGIGVISYFALAAGFLTGKYRSEADFAKSARGGGMSKYLNPRGLRILAALDRVAADSMRRRPQSRWRGSSTVPDSRHPSRARRRSSSWASSLPPRACGSTRCGARARSGERVKRRRPTLRTPAAESNAATATPRSTR